MIIVRLTGGLGNQLFQYALGRRLAVTYQTVMKFDIADFMHLKNRTYSLQNFNVIEGFASPEELEMLYDPHKKGCAKAIQGGKFLFKPIDKKFTVSRERHFHYDPNATQLPDNSYLEGYWQSEKYFKEIEGIIRGEFTVKHPLVGKNLEMSKLISGTDSVSLHVRRGDYVSDPGTNQYHGVCPVSYYYDAIEMINSKVKAPHFFIFSDDSRWVRDNLNIKHRKTFVDFNDSDKAYEDLRLMALCKHHIIANSSFSWWGAWLSRNPEKIVISPERWFQNSALNTKDLLPESWFKI